MVLPLLFALGAKVYGLFSTYQKVDNLIDCVDLRLKLEELQRAYDQLPDKRCRPGPAIREALANLRTAIDKKDNELAKKVLGMVVGNLDIVHAAEQALMKA